LEPTLPSKSSFTHRFMATYSLEPLMGANDADDARTNQVQLLYEQLGRHEAILRLIKPFYADLRQNARLGPIFNAHIQDWPIHLEKIADFWARQTGGPSRYRGGFGSAHAALGIGAEHFQHWLGLWEFNNARQLDPPEAARMNALAHQLAERLFAITQGADSRRIDRPALPPSIAPGG
jgi:hemoglobin